MPRSGGNGPWPTISGTTGHLEDIWKPTAVLVVAVIVVATAKSLGYGSKGQLDRADDATRTKRLPYAYFWVSVAVILAGAVLTATLVDDGPESRYVEGYVIYGLIALFFFVVPEVIVPVLSHWIKIDVFFPSLFRTLAYLERRLPWVALVVVAGLVILLIHLALYPWPDISHHAPAPTSP
ncbi:MAG: hypothetical protein QOF43_1593 [Gaiellaceae bacterium]|nr:hypothetical protein [Gaiellaceae bacterium]